MCGLAFISQRENQAECFSSSSYLPSSALSLPSPLPPSSSSCLPLLLPPFPGSANKDHQQTPLTSGFSSMCSLEHPKKNETSHTAQHTHTHNLFLHTLHTSKKVCETFLLICISLCYIFSSSLLMSFISYSLLFTVSPSLQSQEQQSASGSHVNAEC